MNKNAQYSIGAIIVALILIGGGYYLWNDLNASYIGKTGTQNESGATSTISNEPGVTFGELATPTIPVPKLDRPITFPPSFTPDAQELMRFKIGELTSILQNNPSNFSAWLDLGIRRKQIEDFEGARQAWEYASALQPANNISYLNLGILYHYFLKDYAKAEKNFRTSIQNSPVYPQTYNELHDLYRYSYKQNTTAAIDILEEGLVATNSNINLLVTLAKYYRDVKQEMTNARTYFVQARDAAEKAGNTELAAALDAEISALQ